MLDDCLCVWGLTDERKEEALKQTLTRREAVYWSRSRQQLWHKEATSELVQKVCEVRLDDDQDCLWLRVEGGASCHVGYRSCFYRRIALCERKTDNPPLLEYAEQERVVDPKIKFGDAPSPTRL